MIRAPIPFTRPGEWPARPPGRFAAGIDIGRDLDSGTDATASDAVHPIALLGLPDDNGVRLNGGRPGAASRPIRCGA